MNNLKKYVFPLMILLLAGTAQGNQKSEKKLSLKMPFEMPVLTPPVFQDKDFNITDFGAVMGGEILNKTAFANAIDKCSEMGGGRVIVPSGKWLTVPIILKSNVNLYLSEGAEVLITSEKEYFFPSEEARQRGDMSQPLSPITGDHCENIAITGSGKIDGGGIGWWPLHPRWWDKVKDELPASVGENAWIGLDKNIKQRRPQMFRPIFCKNVWLEGITFSNSPFWTINPVACENLIINKITVLASASENVFDTPNTDGINPESCRNVMIENCTISTGDDSFAIKSGKDDEGRLRSIPSENIVIRNCNARRIAIGSEMSGGIRNVYIHDNKLSGDDNHVIHVKTRRGRGSVVENIWIEDIEISSNAESVLRVDMEYWTHMDPAPYELLSERTPRFRNIHFKNIKSVEGKNKLAIFVNGLPEMPIENLSFDNIQIIADEGIVCNYATDINFKNVQLIQLLQKPVSILNAQDVTFEKLKMNDDCNASFQISGNRTANIQFDKCFQNHAIKYSEGASERSVVFQ